MISICLINGVFFSAHTDGVVHSVVVFVCSVWLGGKMRITYTSKEKEIGARPFTCIQHGLDYVKLAFIPGRAVQSHSVCSHKMLLQTLFMSLPDCPGHGNC